MADQPDFDTVLFAIDESDHSFYALEWALETLPLADEAEDDEDAAGEQGRVKKNKNKKKKTKVILAHARVPPTPTAGLGGAGFLLGADVLVSIERTQFNEIDSFMDKAIDVCKKKKVNAEKLVIVGDPRDAICELVEDLQPIFLIVGSHGYGAIKRAMIGSVSDYFAHHAKCPVIIVKKPN